LIIHLRPIILDVVKQVPEVLPLLSGDARLFIAGGQAKKDAGGYDFIRYRFYAAVFDAIEAYLSGSGNITGPKRTMIVALSQAYTEGADTAYVDGGGTLPLDDDTAAMARGLLDAQFGFADVLFETLKALRREGDFDATGEATARATGYSNSLDILYSTIKLAGAGNTMLTFEGDDGSESCADCQKYKGQRHRASWWIAHNAIPPNREFECHGYNCLHRLYDDSGNEFTV